VPTDHQRQSAVSQLLASFIYELNIARRHLQTYPPGHPMISSAVEKVLAQTEALFASQPEFLLGAADDALRFGDQWLDRSNPNFKDFAKALARLDIAAIRFKGAPPQAELIRLSGLLNYDRQTLREQGGLDAVLKQLQLTSITVFPIDYSAFHTIELDPEQTDLLADSVWEKFLNGLMENTLIYREGLEKDIAKLDPQLIAEILNKHCDLSNAENPAHEQALAQFIEQMGRIEGGHLATGEKFAKLVEHLNPELRRHFLNSTFRHIAEKFQSPEQALQILPSTLVALALEELNREQLNISSNILSLLNKLSQYNNPLFNQLTTGATEELGSIGEQLKTLFREEDKGKFTPESYQQTLDRIVLYEHQYQPSENDSRQLRQLLLESSNERNNSAIIFNLLEEKEIHPEHASNMQANLIELANYFLATGDFKGLTYLHQRLQNFHKKNPEVALERTVQLQEQLNSAEFHKEILDNIARWDERKQQEIAAYIKTAGAAIAGSLIERLAQEEDKSLRRIYLSSLAGLGKKAHPAIYAALADERWFLVRNLLAALRLQRDQVDAKKLIQLENHPHPRINQELLQLLFKFDRDRAEKLLKKQLESNDPKLLLHALQLAELSRDQEVVRKLLTLLTTGKLTDENLPLKRQIVKSLNGIGSIDAIPVLEKLLKPGFLFTSKRKLALQKEIIAQLDKYPFDRVNPLFQKMVRSRQKQLSSLAAEKLRQIIRKQA